MNAFLSKGARRDLKGLSEAAARGKKAMASQTWEIVSRRVSLDWLTAVDSHIRLSIECLK